MGRFLGIDIGGTNVSFGVVNEDFSLGLRENIVTADVKSPTELAAVILKKVKSEMKNGLDGVGIGAPSVNHRTDCIEYAPNLQWDDVVPIKEIFASAFNLPVSVMNDANAAALGEKMFGGARDLNNFAVVTLGTGVGMGLYLKGNLVLGSNSLAGEIGHVIIHRDGRERKTGLLGSLEAYIGRDGITQTAKEKLEFSSGGSVLQKFSPSDLTPQEIFLAARKEDPVAMEVVDAVTNDLAYALSMVVSITDVGTIFLTGGITRSGNILKRKTEKYLKSYILPNFRDKVEIRISELNEINGGILGAAAVARTAFQGVK